MKRVHKSIFNNETFKKEKKRPFLNWRLNIFFLVILYRENLANKGIISLMSQKNKIVWRVINNSY